MTRKSSIVLLSVAIVATLPILANAQALPTASEEEEYRHLQNRVERAQDQRELSIAFELLEEFLQEFPETLFLTDVLAYRLELLIVLGPECPIAEETATQLRELDVARSLASAAVLSDGDCDSDLIGRLLDDFNSVIAHATPGEVASYYRLAAVTQQRRGNSEEANRTILLGLNRLSTSYDSILCDWQLLGFLMFANDQSGSNIVDGFPVLAEACVGRLE